MRVVALVLVVGGAVSPPSHLPNFGHEFTSGWDPYTCYCGLVFGKLGKVRGKAVGKGILKYVSLFQSKQSALSLLYLTKLTMNICLKTVFFSQKWSTRLRRLRSLLRRRETQVRKSELAKYRLLSFHDLSIFGICMNILIPFFLGISVEFNHRGGGGGDGEGGRDNISPDGGERR